MVRLFASLFSSSSPSSSASPSAAKSAPKLLDVSSARRASTPAAPDGNAAAPSFPLGRQPSETPSDDVDGRPQPSSRSAAANAASVPSSTQRDAGTRRLSSSLPGQTMPDAAPIAQARGSPAADKSEDQAPHPAITSYPARPILRSEAMSGNLLDDDDASSLSEVDMSVDEDDSHVESPPPPQRRPGTDNDGDISMGNEAGQGASASTLPSGQTDTRPSRANTSEMKRQSDSKSKRRTMPARLRQVSSLLAGSVLEEELLDTQQKLAVENKALLPPNTRFVLTNDPQVISKAVRVEQDDAPAMPSVLADPDVAKTCRERAIIETPEFKLRDDSEVMGKTRGGSRTEEDTSDAAYERRHRKPENVEKRQRKLELERLVRDRNKLKDRIDQLKAADARLLMPILTARDQQRAAAQQANGDSSSTKVVSDSNGESTEMRLKALRKELLDEARETLARYDLLLPDESRPNASERKRKSAALDEASGQEDSDASTPARSIRIVSGKASRRSVGGSGSPAPSTPDNAKHGVSGRRGDAAVAPAEAKGSSGRSMRIRLKRPNLESSPPSEETSPRRRSIVNLRTSRTAGASPATPASAPPSSGGVVAEHVYSNIHARTSGGRFAPKSALKKSGVSNSGPSTPTPSINTRTARSARSRVSAASSSLPRLPATDVLDRRASWKSRQESSPLHEDRSPSPPIATGSMLLESEIPKREVKHHRWGLCDQGAPFIGLASSSRRGGRRRSVSPFDSGPVASVPTGSLKVGPTLSELRASERKPLRVKLVLNRRGTGHASIASTTAPVHANSAVLNGKVQLNLEVKQEEAKQEDDDDDDDDDDGDSPAEIVMGTALTEEEAKAMLEAALAETMAELQPQTQTQTQAKSQPSCPVPVVELSPPPMAASAPSIKTESPGAHSDRPAAHSASPPSNASTLLMPPPSTTLSGKTPQPAGATVASPSPSATPTPLRRNSSRVQAASAFGERLPPALSTRRDFGTIMSSTLTKRSWRWALSSRGYDPFSPESYSGSNDVSASPSSTPTAAYLRAVSGSAEEAGRRKGYLNLGRLEHGRGDEHEEDIKVSKRGRVMSLPSLPASLLSFATSDGESGEVKLEHDEEDTKAQHCPDVFRGRKKRLRGVKLQDVAMRHERDGSGKRGPEGDQST